MEAVLMIPGPSAGTAAAFAIDDGIALQDLDYVELRGKLERYEQSLIWQK